MNAELTPGVSVSDVHLGASVAEVRSLLGEPTSVRTKGQSTTILHYPSIEVYLVDDAAIMLIAEAPPIHETPEGIRVGATWRQLTNVLPDIVYDEEDGLWYSPSKPGVWYRVARPAYEVEMPLDPPYVPEMYQVNDEHAFVWHLFIMRPKDQR